MPKTETFDRDEILGKVMNLFWVKGYNGTSMQDIVDATGLNRSSIYNSFGDKRQLFEETLMQYQSNQQSGALSFEETASPKEIIRNLFEGILSSFRDKTNLKGCFITNCTAELAAQDDKINHFLSKNLGAMTKVFRKLLEKGKQMGEFRDDLNVEETALYLFSALQGLRLTGMLTDDETEIKAVIDQTLSVL